MVRRFLIASKTPIKLGSQLPSILKISFSSRIFLATADSSQWLEWMPETPSLSVRSQLQVSPRHHHSNPKRATTAYLHSTCSKTCHQHSLLLRGVRKRSRAGTFQAPREEPGGSRTERSQVPRHYRTPCPNIKDSEVAKTQSNKES